MSDNIKESLLTILVVDDEPINRNLIERRLEREGYRVLTAENGREAVEKTREERPDLVLLDVMMPVMDGLEACRLIKDDAATQDIPIIFLSARDETQTKVNALALGANDYISKPFKVEELLARVDVAIRIKRERDHLRASAEEARTDVLSAQEQAMTDSLTGLLNRQALQRSLEHEEAAAHRYNRPLSCLMVALGNLQQPKAERLRSHNVEKPAIADSRKRDAEELLKQTALILASVVRHSDLLFRYDDEKFLLLLPETNLEGAHSLAEKISAAAASHSFTDGQRDLHLNLSVSIATLSDNESGDDVIARADKNLRSGQKVESKNR
ncbi:MAG: response regulator [Pyrinomonadaceae bacterium]